MGKFAYNLKNLFKSKEQQEIEAKMEFNKNKRAFTKYYQELDVSIKNFSRMAKEAELAGNHANATSCSKFVLKLQKTQTKVQGLLQRFEMMYSMQRLTGVMSNFMSACAKMGFSMDSNIDLKGMWKDSAAMEKALNKLDMMSDQMDEVFDTIDAGMNNGEAVPSQEESDSEAEELLNQIMGRHNAANYAVAEPAAAAAVAPDQEGAAQDDTDARLRKMMEELKE